MKYSAHVPVEQYGFILVEDCASPEDAVLAYKDAADLFKGSEGLNDKDWRALIDAYLTKTPYDYESIIGKLNDRQQWCMNQIKLSRVRTEAHRLAKGT